MKCYLTDGQTVAKIRDMGKVELEIANQRALAVTGGNWYWATERPTFDPRVEQGGGYCFNPREVKGL